VFPEETVKRRESKLMVVEEKEVSRVESAHDGGGREGREEKRGEW
jgi:hypothetical protein